MIMLNWLTPLPLPARLVETLGRYRFGIEYEEQGQKNGSLRPRPEIHLSSRKYLLGNAERFLKVL